ncbi:hypothetical protein ACVLD2_000903 [Paenibacillus sp. PvR052]|nr:hypothetical protein [Paenibacillus sp. PvP091]MBP1169426.1 hypothetical protein [Paenibacillus sp. PvR098]MBP2440454.1 hypothetical protein [Paenibacillus sp. PvP052]
MIKDARLMAERFLRFLDGAILTICAEVIFIVK